MLIVQVWLMMLMRSMHRFEYDMTKRANLHQGFILLVILVFSCFYFKTYAIAVDYYNLLEEDDSRKHTCWGQMSEREKWFMLKFYIGSYFEPEVKMLNIAKLISKVFWLPQILMLTFVVYFKTD